MVDGGVTTRTHYVYDEAGHLLAEADGATGAIRREYVWLDDLPLAVIDETGASPAIYAIETGQVGEPIQMTDASGADVWDAFVEPFGAAQVFGTPSLDLRLPGQYAEAEANLLQNWNRDYDPSLGRYVEADPLGIAAGQNVYGYVDGDPLDRSDAQGQDWLTTAGLFFNWLTGLGPNQVAYGPGSSPVAEMQSSPGVRAALLEYQIKNLDAYGARGGAFRPLTNYGFHFGAKGFFGSGLNATQQFVGSYSVDIRPLQGCRELVTITNNTSFKSFMEGIGPDWERLKPIATRWGLAKIPTPMGNMRQTYWWIAR